MAQRQVKIVGRREEREKLHQLSKITGVRSLLFIVGPSGIGKTLLAKSLAGYNDIDLVYTPYLEPPKSVDEAIEALATAIQQAGLRDLVSAVLGDITERSIGARTSELVRARLGRSKTGFQGFSLILEEIASRMTGDRTLVVVLDEAQNLLEALGTRDWSFIKSLASIQEDSDNIRFIIVTSDYFFYERILYNAPSLDYIETFYLGEMTREDAIMLYEETAGELLDRSLIDLVGGKPSHIIGIFKYPDPREKTCAMARKVYYALSTKIAGSECESTVSELLEKIARGPLPVAEFTSIKAEMPSECMKIIEWLIDADILQLACKQHLGIYDWNKGSGGGLCGGLDTIAPSSRTAFTAIVKYLRDKHKTAGALPYAQIDVSAPDYTRRLLNLCS